MVITRRVKSRIPSRGIRDFFSPDSRGIFGIYGIFKQKKDVEIERKYAGKVDLFGQYFKSFDFWFLVLFALFDGMSTTIFSTQKLNKNSAKFGSTKVVVVK